MRTIGNLASQKAAARFSDFLFVRGIENQIEPEDDGTFSLWIIDEDHVASAANMLATFRANPDARDFDRSDDAEKKRRAAEQSDKARRSTVTDDARVAYEQNFQPTPYFTWLLIAMSVAVAIYSKLGDDKLAIHRLFIADATAYGDFILWSRGLADVRAGQVWRLVTPIFIHFGLPHVLFNMMWLKDLGALIETRFGGIYMLALVVVSAALSNLGQYFWNGPSFGGMSGVVYALFGFLWIRGKCDPTAGWQLNPQAVYWMIGWFVLCVTGMVGDVANAAHGAGLAVGMAWGWLSARMRLSR